ncbi:Ser-Thr-rich glycosyl-phosphatidyl-inositol-anchored membrane family-domain-containing protein [Aspergillus cavernicola]|uniref:Ser-Thr-rich glycosyl-phosphatidyl-inositol-anchored membrane family-domain-containing protein n=1 Tax=Aspergillus cavernicola TaxID=176166 RepID=A0ABR4IGF6_9EURO
MRFFTAGLVSALVAVATAYTTPDYSIPPSGNPILTPGLQELVPAGQPYTITWDATTEGLISLVLLRGPSTNVVPLAAIAENIQNTGSYVWTPSTTLEPDVTHYGLLLVVETGANKGAYQWSTQFGIENPNYGEDDDSTSTSTSTTTTLSVPIPSGTPTTPGGTVTETTTVTTTTCPEGEPTATLTSVPSVIPTLTQSPSSPAWTPTFTPAPSQFTGAAGRNAINLGAVAAGVAAVLAF